MSRLDGRPMNVDKIKWPDAMVKRALGLRRFGLGCMRVSKVLKHEFGDAPGQHTVHEWCEKRSRAHLEPDAHDCRPPDSLMPTKFDLALHDEITDVPASCDELAMIMSSNRARVLKSLRKLMSVGWVEYAEPRPLCRTREVKQYIAARTKTA